MQEVSAGHGGPTPAGVSDEVVRLQALARDNYYGQGANAHTVDYCFRVFRRHLRPGRCLELGPAEGLMTRHLAKEFVDLTLVDASPQFCASLRRQFPSAAVVEALFETYAPDDVFDNVVLGHVLEHVIDPVGILRSVRQWTAPGGRLLAAVPNAHSIHRQMAVVMGMLPTESTLNETDARMGHRRVYTPHDLERDVLDAGFRIEIAGGYWLKPISNAQIEKDWSSDMLEAAMQVGEHYPDIAAEIYVIATPA